MERSGRQLGKAIRESVSRFLENAAGRDVIINISARLVKRQNVVVSNDKKKVAEETKATFSTSEAGQSSTDSSVSGHLYELLGKFIERP
uniref:BLOC-1-related complex subunit 7 n=1 Tax=Ascaris lumbricoides TaxID=6252 RepID=A0A0M3HQS3_ASCLU